ncbi:MAG: LysR substrate-binding domain-containing protein [Aquisalimonadaceae bacterium]
MLTLEALQVLDAIARKGSFSAAADTLHRVPSAVTYTVKRLEDGLGVALFDRSGHRAVLTAAGRVVLEQGRVLLGAANDLEATARRMATGWEAELGLAVDAIFPSSTLFPLVRAFDAESSGVRLRILQEVQSGSWDALVSGRADLVVGVMGDGPAGGGYTCEPLGEVPFVFVAAPDHPICKEPLPLSPAAIRRHRGVAVADTARDLPVRTTGVQAGQNVLTVPSPVDKHIAHESGLGVGFLPRFHVRESIRAGRLRQLPVAEPRQPQTAWLAWRSREMGKGLRWWVERLRTEAPGFLHD